jgi:hypothetical protein
MEEHAQLARLGHRHHGDVDSDAGARVLVEVRGAVTGHGRRLSQVC